MCNAGQHVFGRKECVNLRLESHVRSQAISKNTSLLCAWFFQNIWIDSETNSALSKPNN